VTTAKKTARKTTKAAGKTTKGPGSRGRSAAAKTVKAKQAVLERMAAFGLLNSDAVERLERKAEALLESGAGDAPASWDRALVTSLDAFEEAGGDGSVKRGLQSLVLWSDAVRNLPATAAGLEQALAAIKRVVPYHGASLYVRNPHHGGIETAASVGFPVDLISRIRFQDGAGFSSWVAARQKPVLYASLHRNEAPGCEHVRSFMSVPLVIAGETLGVVNVGHRDEDAYDEPMLRRLILVAGGLAALVQRFVSLEQIRAREIRDAVTGLATAAYFRERLDEEIVRCRELGHAMSLCVLRLNELPAHAEQFGPEFQGRCRADLARVVREWKDPSEFVGHGDKDSLIVLFPSARREKAESRAAALAEALGRHNFPRRKRMTMGYGIGTYPTDAEDAQELLDFVDKASCEAVRSRGEVEGLPHSLAL
jgi:GGDEF domain-containing protein